jgi:AraC family transcriptional activator of pobA
MDARPRFWYFSDMKPDPIPAWQLYGETQVFPDVLHIERIFDRAAGLDWSIAAHRHLHLHQIFLLASGDTQMTVDGEVYRIIPPCIVNIPRGSAHGFAFSAGTEGYVLTLPADDFPDIFGPNAETASPIGRVFTLAAAGDLKDRFDTLNRTHADNRLFRRTALRAEATALIAKVLEQAQIDFALRPQILPILHRFEALVHASLHTRRSIDSYACALALSARHLTRLCKLHRGLTAQAFVQSHKMREACRLLVYTRMTVQQVAYHLGYDDPAYFSRVFH